MLNADVADDILFDNPPVVETVLGVQYAPIPGFIGAHLGWFWKSYLDASEWPTASNTFAVPDQFETFDAPNFWTNRLQIHAAATLDRLQIESAGKDRMIQVQPSRFHYNWQRQQNEYPRYKNTLAEFGKQWTRFGQFIDDAKLKIVPNQWELTYVNAIRRPLWNTASDWPSIFPGLLAPPPTTGVRFESIGGEWHFEIPPKRGRLHISMQDGFTRATGQENVLIVQLTARGPIQNDASVVEGLNLGHDVIVKSFVDISSKAAHEVWRKR